MRWTKSLLLACSLACTAVAVPTEQAPFELGKHSKPLTKGGVAWDKKSLIIDGERVVLWSGEFHPWRLPVPALWLDVLQKIKALGFNAISFYSHWGINNPANGTLDFEGWRGYQSFLDDCMKAGLWVVVRPGPYINAETTGGGIPGWVLASGAKIRTNDPEFEAMWRPYWKAMAELSAKNQWDAGGPVIMVQIENEYFLDGQGTMDLDYIQALEREMIESGVTVPLSFNDVGMKNRLVRGPGHVDLYGFDSYPQSLDAEACGIPQEWRPVDERYHAYFKSTLGKVGVPFYIPEFQGGTINQWTQPVVDDCQPLFGAEFERVFYLHNLASGVKMHNVYMVYGGTNWGGLAFPPSTTTYDYFAAIREDRSLRGDKYGELKVISHFLRSSPDFAGAEVVNREEIRGTGGKSDKVIVTELENDSTRARFYIARHANSSSLATTEFKVRVKIGSRKQSLPRNGHLTLNGRDSRIIATNYHFGASRIAYTTSRIMLSTTIGEEDLLLVYGDDGETHELGFEEEDVESTYIGEQSLATAEYDSLGVLTFRRSQAGLQSVSMVSRGRNLRILLADSATAYATWQPVLRNGDDKKGSFWKPEGRENVIVVGPYLVRDAVRHGRNLNIIGDLNESVSLLVFAPPDIESIQWNGKDVGATRKSANAWEADIEWETDLEFGRGTETMDLELSAWRYADSLPEIGTFDDSEWVKADHKSTPNLFKPYPSYKGKSVLYAQDYGYHQGNLLFRGHFTASGKETHLTLSLSPGRFGAGSVWLNGEHLGSASVPIDKTRSEDVNVSFPLDSDILVRDKDNIITVLTDHMGYEETNQFTDNTNDAKSPRGIRGYELVNGGEIDWNIQGNLGGNWAVPDPVRSMINEGGLFAERQRWHLPSFDDSSWPERPINQGIESAGVGFFRSSFTLDVPVGVDLAVNVVYPDHKGAFRSQLWINGWMMGKRVGDLGPQLQFPIPPGILANGTNTIAVSHWALESDKDALSSGAEGIKVVVSGLTETGYDMGPTWNQYV